MACMHDNPKLHILKGMPEEPTVIFLYRLELALFLESDAVTDLEFLAECN